MGKVIALVIGIVVESALITALVNIIQSSVEKDVIEVGLVCVGIIGIPYIVIRALQGR